MTKTQYSCNNSLTPELKWASFEKRNNLDELINIPTKDEERSMIQILFRTQDPNIRQAQSGIRVKNYSWSTILTVISKSANPLDLLQKSTIRDLLKAKSVDPKTYSPPSLFNPKAHERKHSLIEIVQIFVCLIFFGVCLWLCSATESSLTSLGIFSFLASLKHRTVFEHLYI